MQQIKFNTPNTKLTKIEKQNFHIPKQLYITIQSYAQLDTHQTQTTNF